MEGHIRTITSNFTMRGMEAMRYAILNEGSYYCRPIDSNGTEMFSASKPVSLHSLIGGTKYCHHDKLAVVDEDIACAGNIFDIATSKLKVIKYATTFIMPTKTSAMLTSQSSVVLSPTAALERKTIEKRETLETSATPTVISLKIPFDVVESRKNVANKQKRDPKPWIFLLGTIASIGLVIIVLVFVIGAAMLKKKKARKLE